MADKELNFYVYSVDAARGEITYERTCGDEATAKRRVEDLYKHYDGAFYSKKTVKGAFY